MPTTVSSSPSTGTSDRDLLELVRVAEPIGVAEMASQLGVTPTAVRQRLGRLMARGLVCRDPIRGNRGRPKHTYRLTDDGRRQTGTNFTDLALALWREFSALGDKQLQEKLLRRLAKGLAAEYADEIQGTTLSERVESLAELMRQREVPVSVTFDGQLPVLVAHACPYADLADEDRSICSMERMLFTELLGRDVELSACRLDGNDSCRFRGT